MELAKPRVDIGMSTNNLEAVLAFWQGEAGVAFDHLLPIRRGQDQHRHDANGSVLKINAYAEPVPAGITAGASKDGEKTLTRAQFNALPPHARMEFVKAKGKITA